MFLNYRNMGRRKKSLLSIQIFFIHIIGLSINVSSNNYNILDRNNRLIKLYNIGIDKKFQNLLWLAFFSSFAVKTPMWPVHTWLPDAHVEAPTAGSVILAAILIKNGWIWIY